MLEPDITALKRLRQGDPVFKTSLSHTVRPCVQYSGAGTAAQWWSYKS